MTMRSKLRRWWHRLHARITHPDTLGIVAFSTWIARTWAVISMAMVHVAGVTVWMATAIITVDTALTVWFLRRLPVSTMATT